MRCGSCRGEHPTVAEVRQCYAQTGKSNGPKPKQVTKRTHVPARLTGNMTVKQEQYLRALLEQTGEQMTEDEIGAMTFNTASELIGRLVNKRKEMSRKEGGGAALPANVLGAEVPQGIYTVVFDAEKDDRITLRFKVPPHSVRWEGIQLVGYLAGPDNTHDYRRCANRTPDGYRLWSQYRENGRIKIAIEHLMGNDQNQEEAGMLYSLESGNCRRCGRLLTVPASVHRGLGPECAGILGVR